MSEITRTLLSSLRLAPASPASKLAKTATATSQDTTAPSRPGIVGWLRGRVMPEQPLQEGLSVRQALGELQKGGHLPSVAAGSPSKHVRSLLNEVPAGDRASVVAAARFLLPPKVNAAVYDAVVAHLLTLAPGARTALARVVGHLSRTLCLEDADDAHAYVGLLQAIESVPSHRRDALVTTCQMMQPFWQQDMPPECWTHCLLALAGLPEAQVPDVANDIRRLYASATDTPAAMKAFLQCVTQHASLGHAARAVLRKQAKQTQIASYDSPSGGLPGPSGCSFCSHSQPTARGSG